MSKRDYRRWAYKQLREPAQPWPLWVRVLLFGAFVLVIEAARGDMKEQSDLIGRLQALLAMWDEQAASAARKLEHSENPSQVENKA